MRLVPATLIVLMSSVAWAQAHVVSDSRVGMATRQQIFVWSDDDAKAHKAIDAAFAELERVENVLSEWKNDSEVSRLNQNAGKGPVPG